MIPNVGLAYLPINIGIQLRERRVKGQEERKRQKRDEKGMKKGEVRKKKQWKMEEVPSGI